ncbi:MAG: long-chain fatty acid--CoA ligase [Rhodothermales bacterium]|nr:long-chain fatty acid--CoA ligase [Rhodothermales bacterium]
MPAIVDFNTIPQLFNRVADYYKGTDKVAMSFKDKTTKEWTGITWDELRQQVHMFAGYLHSLGFKRGDRLAILSENRPEWAIADLAQQILGGINVSLYTSLPSSQVEYILNDSGASIFVVSTGLQLKKAEAVFDKCPDLKSVVAMSELRKEHPDYVIEWEEALKIGKEVWTNSEKELSAIAETIDEDDLSSLIYTSGTTGKPKGVMLTHRNFCSNCREALELVQFGPEDVHLSFLPLCHSFERTGGYHCVMAAGAKITYAESIDTVSRNLPEVKPTVMISVPRLFEKVYNTISKNVAAGPAIKQSIFEWSLNSGRKSASVVRSGKTPGPILKLRTALAHRLVFSKLHEKLGNNLRFAVSGGAALPREIGEFFEAAGVLLIEGYGLTETSPVLTLNPLKDPRYGTVGRVLPGVTVAIQRLTDQKIVAEVVGTDKESTLTSEEGEIIAKGPNIMRGYWNNDEATSESIDPDGWYHTGDVGRFKDGYLQITDRIKHMIVSKGGKNIYPGPIEDQLKQLPGIDQILVVGEGRSYLTALVVPDTDTIRSIAGPSGNGATESDLLTHEAVIKHFEGEFKRYSRSSAAHEKIRGFKLIEEPFTVENELLTPTLKPRRKQITERYAELIEEMYASDR